MYLTSNRLPKADAALCARSNCRWRDRWEPCCAPNRDQRWYWQGSRTCGRWRERRGHTCGANWVSGTAPCSRRGRCQRAGGTMLAKCVRDAPLGAFAARTRRARSFGERQLPGANQVEDQPDCYPEWWVVNSVEPGGLTCYQEPAQQTFYVTRTKPHLCVASAAGLTENHEFSPALQESLRARAQSGAAWRAFLVGASWCLSEGRVKFAPLSFPWLVVASRATTTMKIITLRNSTPLGIHALDAIPTSLQNGSPGVVRLVEARASASRHGLHLTASWGDLLWMCFRRRDCRA